MNQKKNNKKGNLIILAILLVILYFAYQYYQSNNFYDFIRSEARLYTSQFKKDKEIKYGRKRSYEIESSQYNDAMFYKSIEVKKNQPYKVTCMVKTENVEPKEEKSGVGAQISIEGSTERSVAISGTQDWQKIEMIFNSKDREKVNIGFRLGGCLGQAKGKAWFSNFTIEEGIANQDSAWKFACFIFKTTDVNINQKQIKLEVTEQDVRDIENTIKLFETSCRDLSNGKMSAKCDIYQVETPLSKLSYDDEFGYYVSAEDIENQIKDTIATNDYDHIFIIVRLGDEQHENDIEVNDWVGLGAMDYYGIGFSNIRLPNDSKSYIYKYNTRINTFPEEVFLHEFLHSLERNAKEYGYDIPELHDYEKYGYENEVLIGEKKWYTDYMNQNINIRGSRIGLPKEVYILKPAKNSNFEYSYKMEKEFKEPENIKEEIGAIIQNLIRKFEMIKK